MSLVEFTPWPEDLAHRYRAKGYWIGRPLCAGVEAQAAARPEAPAILCGERVFTYGRLEAEARALAAALARRGLGHGDTALVQLPNVAEFHLVFLALMKIGVVPVNALFSHKRRELSGYARQIAPKLLIADRSHPLFADDAFAEELAAANPGLAHVILRGETGERGLAALLAEGAPLASGPLPPGAGPTPPGEVAFFQLSGGSTGTPKLIPRTHDDYDYSLRESAAICGVTQATRFLCALPAPHNFLMSSPGALGVFHAGGCVVMASGPEPKLCFDLIARHRVTLAALVPPAVALWIEAAERLGPPAPLRQLLVGGASFAESLARQVGPKLGCRLQQVFGMAEGLVSYTRPEDPEELICTSQGRPISPDDEIRILDPAGRPVPEGEPGELATRGPYTMRGYYRAPEQNTRVLDAEGFFHTGDIVRRLPSGHLRVVGRVKDQINRGGEKIAAEEIEHLLLRHPAVRQAALVPVADAALGEKSCAFVTLRAPVKGVELRRHLLALGIADYKLPDRFRILDTLPLTAVGKPDKLSLRALLEATA